MSALKKTRINSTWQIKKLLENRYHQELEVFVIITYICIVLIIFKYFICISFFLRKKSYEFYIVIILIILSNLSRLSKHEIVTLRYKSRKGQ